MHEHTEDIAYLEHVRDRLIEVAQLIDAAPSGYTLTIGIRMLRTLSNRCQRSLQIAYALADDGEYRPFTAWRNFFIAN